MLESAGMQLCGVMPHQHLISPPTGLSKVSADKMQSSRPNLLPGLPTRWAKVQPSPTGTSAMHFP
eukprot:15051836-Heterocapsa_arctica.AAC.1